MMIMLLGCILGFSGGLYAYFGLSYGLFLSVSIWAASGPLSILLLVALAALRHSMSVPKDTRQPEIA